MSDLARHLTALEQEFADLGGYRPEQVVTSAPRQGGVLDQLGIVPPKKDTPDRNGVLDKVGQVAALLDHWTMGIPTTVAGLVNSAIPGQPLGDMWSIKDNAETARNDLSRGALGRDLLALPEAFGGMVPGGVGHYAVPGNARALADTTAAGARQAGRLADAAIDPIYQAMPDNSVGMFGGKLAKTADHAALSKAEDLAAAGVPRDQIWNDTGWFQGKDGKWRFEIDDSGARYDASAVQMLPLGDKLSHPGVMSAYPHLNNVKAYTQPGSGAAYGGDSIVVGRGVPAERQRSGVIHEVQHGIQDNEGFARGGNMREFSPDQLAAERARILSADSGDGWTSINTAAGDMTDTEVARRLYNRLAGEVEARTVQKRMDLTPDQRRARAPWLDYDVPEDQQIVRFGGSGPQMSMGDGSSGGKLTPAPGITAYHGSPHDFDRFDMSKIGTGEGAQAYGHGLYFAESEGVAKSYRDALGGKSFGPKADGTVKWTFDGQPADIANNPTHLAAWRLNQEGDPAKALAALERERDVKVMGAKPGTPEYDYVGGPQYDQAIAALRSGADLPQPQRPGRLYEVRINADPADFLDWDKPLSQQSEKVRGALAEKGWKIDQFGNKTGGDLIQYGMGAKGQEQAAMLEAGIPGIRYLDQGSRSAGEGSRNYVVFDDKIIDILKKYGIVGTAGAGGAMLYDPKHAAMIEKLTGAGTSNDPLAELDAFARENMAQ